MTDIVLNEDERDCLQELMNVAYGSATAAISEILDAFAQLAIPKIKIIDAIDFKDYLLAELDLNEEHLIALQEISGSFNGENMFVINKKSASNIALKFGIEENEINDEEISDVALEITNILSSSTIGKLAENMDANVSFSAPIIKLISSANELNNLFINSYKKVIIISTELNFEDLNISGELFIFTTDNSILFIKEKLNQILEEL